MLILFAKPFFLKKSYAKSCCQLDVRKPDEMYQHTNTHWISLPKKGLYANPSEGLSLNNVERLWCLNSVLCTARCKILFPSQIETCRLDTSNEERPKHNNLGSVRMSRCRVKLVCHALSKDVFQNKPWAKGASGHLPQTKNIFSETKASIKQCQGIYGYRGVRKREADGPLQNHQANLRRKRKL